MGNKFGITIRIIFISLLSVLVIDALAQLPASYPADIKVNSIRTWNAVKRETNPDNITTAATPEQFIMTTQYSDGVGRPIQIIVKQGSLISGGTAVDMVGAHVYDGFGREQFTFLPSPANNADGNPHISDGLFKLNPFQQQQAFYSDPNGVLKGQSETYFYGETTYDGSPLNRVTKMMRPGNSWVGSQVGVEYEYQINTAAEKVHIWNISFTIGAVPTTLAADVYPSGQLYKNITIDENGMKVFTYTDKSGKTILKKVQDKNDAASGLTDEHAGWLCTYYVYDDFGRLRYIIPPKAVVYLDTHNWIISTDVANELCFSNEYDSRGRLVVKKSPGADAVYYVYDTRDRPVFSQDGNQRNQTPKKWMATLYDNLDRPTLTGTIEYNDTRENLQAYVNSVSNTGDNGAINVSSQTPTLIDLVVSQRDNTIHDYNAANSVTFNPGFESEAGADFVVEIMPTGTSESNTIAVNGNPLPPGNNLYTLTLTYYDDYSYAGAKTFSTNFTVDNTVPADEFEEVESTLQTIGYVTGTKVRLLDGSNTFLNTTSFYDRKGRNIQIVGDNHKGFTDEITTQYDFSGKVRSTYETNRFDGTEGITVFTKNEFDMLGRVTAIIKTINGTEEKTIATYAYDALGRLTHKTLAPGFAGPDDAYLESQDYSYNIQGWLLGINKEYATSTTQSGHFFGMELGYDKPGAAGFSNTQVNGNIAGNAWKTRGDNVSRKYDYDYDNINQLTGADFHQMNDPGAAWTQDEMNFSSGMSYDGNGNIQTLNRWGMAVGSAPQQIDQLVYHYDMVAGGWTNRLKNIEETAASGMNGNLGDFQNGPVGPTLQQYTYDDNGNLRKDLNKEIGSSSAPGITYNYMNLPTLITFENTNTTIAYIYDAVGNKLRKILDVPADGANPARHIETDYLNGYVYQNNELQFFIHEEGRVRKTTDGAFVYDYFIRDHLGNVRMVLTEEQKFDPYPTATLEGSGPGSTITEEQEYYDINSSYVFDKPVNVSPADLLDYINDNGTNNPSTFGNKYAVSEKMYRLNGATNRTGYSKILKVMAGDKIDILAKSYYHYSGGTVPGNNLIAGDIINAFIGVVGGGNPAVQHGATTVILNNNTTDLVNPLNIFTNNNPANPDNQVKAGLSYVILDEEFNFVAGGYDPVNGDQSGGLKNHFIQNVTIPKNGYIYIYCSNESNIDVFFDNLEVIHTRGPILEENHFYSYGLKIAAISTQAAGGIQNNYLYQGAFSEFDEENGYNEFFLRHYDAQVGRWTTIDPYEEFANLYLGMANNPVTVVDPSGGCVWCETLEKALTLPEIVINAVVGRPSSSWFGNLLANSQKFITPMLNYSINELSKTGKGISWFGRGLYYEGLLPTMDWVNHNINPVYGVFNGINSQFTHEDFLHRTPMTPAEGASDFLLSAVPVLRVEGAIVKSFEKAVLKRGVKTAAKGVDKVKYIGRMEDLKGIPRSQTLLDNLPNLGSPKANYYQNMSVLRKVLRDGYTIKDASWFRPNSELAPTLLNPNRTVGQTFLGAERLLLQNRGLWP